MSVASLNRHFGDVIESACLEPGRKPHVPSSQTRKVVKMMAAIGVPKEDMAAHLSILVTTLDEHYAEEIRLGSVSANTAVAGNLFKMATGSPDIKTTVIAAIWWSKARMGWKETTRSENTGPNGGPIQHQHAVMVYLPDNGRGDGPEATDTRQALMIDHDPSDLGSGGEEGG